MESFVIRLKKEAANFYFFIQFQTYVYEKM